MNNYGIEQLESHLWESANILRGPVDAADFKTYIFPLLFFKRISDVYDEEFSTALEESGGDRDFAAFPENHRFQIPEGCHWNDVRERTTNVGEALQPSSNSWTTDYPRPTRRSCSRRNATSSTSTCTTRTTAEGAAFMTAEETIPEKIPVWKMIQEAVHALGSPTTNVAVRDWIIRQYPGTNMATIQAQITICTVNHDSRVHYTENRKPRQATDSRYDFLFRVGRGELELYEPARHGTWSILETEAGRLAVLESSEIVAELERSDAPPGDSFAAENHLRDYLALHLDVVEPGLQLFNDENGVTGVEYITPIGRIDILAVDTAGGFVVVELKVGRGPDAVAGQLLRYRNWVAKHLAAGRRVRGFIIAQSISDRIRYSLMGLTDIYAKEYELVVTLRDAALD